MQRWVACLWAVAMVVGASIAPRATAQSIHSRAFNGFRRYTGPTTVTSKDASVLVIPCSGYVAAVANVSVDGGSSPTFPLPPPHALLSPPCPPTYTIWCIHTCCACGGGSASCPVGLGCDEAKGSDQRHFFLFLSLSTLEVQQPPLHVGTSSSRLPLPLPRRLLVPDLHSQYSITVHVLLLMGGGLARGR
jgi:hypothetical protein